MTLLFARKSHLRESGKNYRKANPNGVLPSTGIDQGHVSFVRHEITRMSGSTLE